MSKSNFLQMPTLEKIDYLINSIDYEREDILYHISQYKKGIKKIHLTLDYNFFISYLYYHRLYKNWSLPTCLKHIQTYLKYSKNLNFSSLNFYMINSIYLEILQDKKISQSTKHTHWKNLKAIIRFSGYPINLSDMNISKSKKRLNNSDLLTPKEFKLIVKELGNHRLGKGLEYQCFFVSLADTGLRFNENFQLNKNNLTLNENNYYTSIIEGKNTNSSGTNEREVILYHSSLMFKILLSNGWKKWSFSYNAFRCQLKRVCERLGIEKRVYNHLLRHNFNSFTATRSDVTPEIRKSYTGYSKGSNVYEDVYVHFSNKKVIEEMIPIIKENPLFQ